MRLALFGGLGVLVCGFVGGCVGGFAFGNASVVLGWLCLVGCAVGLCCRVWGSWGRLLVVGFFAVCGGFASGAFGGLGLAWLVVRWVWCAGGVLCVGVGASGGLSFFVFFLSW